MTYTRFCRALPLLCALALAGCGLTASPADGLAFKAPSLWQSSPGIMGYMQFWKSPSTDGEVLMLFKSPKPMKTSEVFDNAKLKDATVQEQREIKICGNQPAMYVKALATTKTDTAPARQSETQMVMTTAGGNTFFAVYLYPKNAEPDADAVRALHELCPVKS